MVDFCFLRRINQWRTIRSHKKLTFFKLIPSISPTPPQKVAAALEKVSGVKCTAGLAMPQFLRNWFLNDLHHMCLFFENEGGFQSSIEEFKNVVPDAFGPEEWLRFTDTYHNGEKIGKE